MHDPRYASSKSLTAIGPEWARGCEHCEFGIVLAPDILAAFPINEGRAVQAADGMIEFCNCRAGHMYRQHARHTFSAMSGELRNNIREHIEAASVPTVHGVTAATEQEPA